MDELKRRLTTQRAKQSGLFVALVLLTSLALTPLLRADSPCTHDGGLHYFRITAMRHALGEGHLLMRWSPDLAFGYGYPFFNYRAASSYYLGLALFTAGLPLPLALNLVYVLSLVGSALGAFLLGRDLFGRRAGLVAAVAYVYAPYTFIDALTRGNMPESVALALLPWVLWAFRRLLLSGRPRYLLLSAGTLALLSVSHNISLLLFTPFLGLYLLVLWLARGRRDHLVIVCWALALGLGLTAFFWAPAVLEMNDVQLHMSRTTRNNDYHYNFIGPGEILAAPEPSDPALLNPPLRLPVGLPLAVLALLGTVAGLWRWRSAILAQNSANAEQDLERWTHVAFFALSALVMLFMSTSASLPLWENIPLLPFVQFPWRFIGRAVLPLSFLAAALVPALPRHPKFPTPYSLISIPLLILGALPFTYPPTGYCPTEPQPDILDVFAYEHSTGLVGVDPEGSYFPVTVKTRPSGSPLEAQYAAGQSPIARLDQASLPAGSTIHRARYEPNRAELDIETPAATRARYFTFAFPGWRVLVDGRPTDIIPSDPEGLITFDLPAGRHTVEVAWGSTPLRTVATFVSLLALAGAIYLAYSSGRDEMARRLKRLGKAPTSAPAPAPWKVTPIAPLEWKEIALPALLALLLLAFKLAWVDQGRTPWRRPGLDSSGSLPGLDAPLDVRFEDGVHLLGYDYSAQRLPADGALHLAFYWSAYARPNHSYKSTVALRGPDGQLWSDKTALPRRGYSDLPPSPAWGDGRYAVEGLDVEALPGAPPGRYDLLLTAFDRQTLAPLNALNEAGQVSGPSLVVGQVELTRPSSSPRPDDTAMQTRLNADLGPLTLAGVNLDRAEAAPGDPALVTLFWILDIGYSGSSGKDLPDLGARLTLMDEEGTEAMTWELPPVRDDWPTTLWEPGDLWRGQHLLRLPAALESGDYVWQLDLYGSANQRVSEESVELGRLRVNAPERLWQAPPVQLPLDVELGQQAALLGANLEPASVQPSASLTVTLVWQARAEMSASYRVFLHLLNPDGSLLTQSDGEPAAWTRPTTGWAPGEIILDQHTLQIPADAPPGPYTLLAGLYDPRTSDRLPAPDGATAVTITTLEQP